MSTGSLAQKARDELRHYAVVAGYLYVCFAALLLYRAALLQQDGLAALPHGLAAFKALVLGKFLLIGEAVGLGQRVTAGTLASRVAIRSLLYFALLLVLSMIEELVVGLVHGRTVTRIAAEFSGQSAVEILAKCLIMLLVLIPLIAFQQLKREGRLD